MSGFPPLLRLRLGTCRPLGRDRRLLGLEILLVVSIKLVVDRLPSARFGALDGLDHRLQPLPRERVSRSGVHPGGPALPYFPRLSDRPQPDGGFGRPGRQILVETVAPFRVPTQRRQVTERRGQPLRLGRWHEYVARAAEREHRAPHLVNYVGEIEPGGQLDRGRLWVAGQVGELAEEQGTRPAQPARRLERCRHRHRGHQPAIVGGAAQRLRPPQADTDERHLARVEEWLAWGPPPYPIRDVVLGLAGRAAR